MGTDSEHAEPDCQRQFQVAVSVIQNLPKNGSYRPAYEDMLRFYSYYKQATMGPCRVPRPGFWDPIGRYKWDAWNSLGRMSKEEAMSAYISQMKRVAQKVIDTVPLGEVAEEMFGYFEPLYHVIPDMPRPPESFLRRVAGHTGQVVHDGTTEAAPQPHCPPEELAPPNPGASTPKEPDAEDFCDSVELLEPEVQAKQRAPPGGGPSTRNVPSALPTDRENMESSMPGPREPDLWLVRTIRGLQDNMREVQGRLRSLENMPQPPKQQTPGARPWPLRLSRPTLLFFLLWPFIVQWLLRQLRAQKR